MRTLKTAFVSLLVGFLLGGGLVAWIGFSQAPGLMLKEQPSAYDLEQTVKRLSSTVESNQWVVSSVMKLDQSIKKHGGPEIRPVHLVNICQPQQAGRILQNDDARIVSVMMPCTIAVYEKADGRTYIGTMNAKLMGRIFGGVVAEVMGGVVNTDQTRFVAEVAAAAPTSDTPTP